MSGCPARLACSPCMAPRLPAVQRDHQTGAACSGSWPGRSNRLPSARSSRSCCSSSRPQSGGSGGGAEVEVESPTPAAPLRAPERRTAGSCRASVRPRGCVEAARLPRRGLSGCHVRRPSHVSNVQRGGDSHGTTEMPTSNKNFMSVRPTGGASQLPGPGREVDDRTPSAPSAM